MKKMLVSLGLVCIMALVLVGCDNDNEEAATNGTGDTQTQANEEALEVLVTFSVIADMTQQIGGDYVVVTTIVPIGETPEDYEFTPNDVINATDADLIFYNGLEFEHEYEWFDELMATAGREKDVDFFALTDGLEAVRLLTPGLEDYYDPHLWMDPLLGMGYVDNIVAVLSEAMPERADYFAANGEAFNAEIYAVYTEWSGRFDAIPAERNLLVTAEGAFRYFGYRFNVNTDFIWEFNAEDEGTPEQFIRIIETVNASNVAHLFVESSIDPDYIEQVSQETDVPIFDGYLFTDSLSEAGGPASTYLDFLTHNLATIYAGLTAE